MFRISSSTLCSFAALFTWLDGGLTAQGDTPLVGDEYRAIDYAKVSRRIGKQPTYVVEPLYAMFVFGHRGECRMWAALDKSKKELPYFDVLYLDKNGNGDLTEAGERITSEYSENGARAGMAVVLRVGKLPVPGTGIVHERFEISTVRKKGRTGIWFRMKWGGKHEVSGGYGPVGTNTTNWTKDPKTAPILRPHPSGPLSFALYSWGEKNVTLRIGGEDKAYVMAGNKGSGPDTLCVVDEHFLDLALEALRVTVIGKDAKGAEVRCKTRLRGHC